MCIKEYYGGNQEEKDLKWERDRENEEKKRSYMLDFFATLLLLMLRLKILRSS